MSSNKFVTSPSKPSLSEVMESARLKVQRANRHIDEISADQSAMPKHLFDLVVAHRSVALLAQPDGDFLRYYPKQSVSKHFGAIVGDTVNNLRESLDFWVNSAALCVGPKRKLHFPFSQERKDLGASKNFGLLKKAFPEAARFVEEKIEPCRDTNLYLWAATSLCNDNKHNDFVPVVSAAQIHAKSITFGTNSINGMSVGGNADQPIRVIHAPFRSISIEGNLNISAEATFPKGAIFEGQAVVPTLTHMSRIVSQTLDTLENFIRPYCR